MAYGNPPDPYGQGPNPYGAQPPNPYGAQPPNPYGAQQPGGYGPPAGAFGPPSGYPQPYGGMPTGSLGKIRPTGICILLAIVTLGIYSLFWYYNVHNEMKQHSGRGLGGGVALLLAFCVGIVMPYLTSSEVGGLYAARNQPQPVSGTTGLWYFPGIFIIVGPIIWFVKTNGALNNYWASQGATR